MAGEGGKTRETQGRGKRNWEWVREVHSGDGSGAGMEPQAFLHPQRNRGPEEGGVPRRFEKTCNLREEWWCEASGGKWWRRGELRRSAVDPNCRKPKKEAIRKQVPFFFRNVQRVPASIGFGLIID